MNNMEFNSQICTTKSQSEALLKLGLKKDTADMYYTNAGLPFIKDEFHLECKSFKELSNNLSEISPFTFIPAWSLHRLMEIIQNNEKEVSYILDREDLTIEWFDNGGWRVKLFKHIENNIYNSMISCIEYMLKEGLINPEYLEKQK